MTASSDIHGIDDDQQLTPTSQAHAWFQLLLVMTVPVLLLLVGISFSR